MTHASPTFGHSDSHQNVAFVRTNHESRCFIVWEIECGNGYLPGFVVTGVNEFQGLMSWCENQDR